MVEVRQIAAKETYPIRLELLRENSPISHVFQGDEDVDSFHLGVFVDENLVAVSSYMKSSFKNFEGTQYQLRGMATQESFQGKGLGKEMLQKAEIILKEKNIEILWCNAREVALEFYKKQGFRLVGDLFDIPYAGLHSVMYKKL
ncbi:GNAT family N-acetyltransferase [Flavicella sediminum]|uniref:GNAT family N-acetyltransferase n=1 Tax=Flavicella sediminum TaxID=2585141 RepID=UPI00111CA0A2|nr:GNAT family N-acetyltransferase [Flavicella sediminum]